MRRVMRRGLALAGRTSVLAPKTFVRPTGSVNARPDLFTNFNWFRSISSSAIAEVGEDAARLHLDHDKRRLVVCTKSGQIEEYPWVWLRDNCQCHLCFEPEADSRIVNLAEFNIHTVPLTLKVDGDTINIGWDDGHQSVYNYEWLLKRSFRPEARSDFSDSLTNKAIMWGREEGENFPTADYSSIMNDDSEMLAWLSDLDRHGFVLVRNTPVREGPVPDLQKRIAFEKLTHYGPGYTVEIKSDPSNVSCTYHRIFFHTDLTFYEHMPGTIFLHCIKQHEGPGGETMLADGFYAADKLRRNHPEKYALLANLRGYWKDKGRDYIHYNKIIRKPVFLHDMNGDLTRINWSHFARDSHLDIDIDKVEQLYDAMRTFDDILNDEDNHIRFKMQPGDMVTVKNQRILHGRSELKGGVSSRYLQCGYMDWDEIESRTRVLRAKLR